MGESAPQTLYSNATNTDRTYQIIEISDTFLNMDRICSDMRSTYMRSLMGCLLLGLLVTSSNGVALNASAHGNSPFETPPTPQAIDGYQHRAEVVNGTPQGYTFHERVRVQYYGNVTTELNMTCDDAVPEMNMSIEYYALKNVSLDARMNATNPGLNLTNRVRIQAQNGSLYQFKYMLVLNLSRNETEDMVCRLRLRIQERDRNSTWAWYNATSGKFETIQSWYEAETCELVANTTHFSTFVVLTGISDVGWWVYGVVAGSIVAVVLIYIVMSKKRKTVKTDCPDEEKINGQCP